MATSIIDTNKDNSERPRLYQQIKELCSLPCRSRGPDIDLETLCTNPDHQKECMDHVLAGSQETFSPYISELMDSLGYSYDMIKYRQWMFAKYDRLLTLLCPSTLMIHTAGSKGEGTALLFESDFDSMYILRDVVCVDNPHHPVCQEKGITVFQAERCESFPGYTRLKLLKIEGKSSEKTIRASLFRTENGMDYWSSHLFASEADNVYRSIQLEDAEVNEQKGPSLPISCKSVSYDNVFCVKFLCPDILENWVKRHRRHGWPKQDIIHEISRLDGHLVPIGFKGSPYVNMEWRICYTLAEQYLMQTFNETQLKVYILLKKISKSVSHKECEDMTSYVMKNVVFWISENKGVEKFRPDKLMDRLFDCLKYLKTCVIKNYLPSYMIPKRNLLAGRLKFTNKQRKQRASLLNDLLQKGNRMFLRCDTLRDAMIVMYKTPDLLTDFHEKREKIERRLHYIIEFELLRLNMRMRELCELVLQTSFTQKDNHLARLLHIDLQELRQAGTSEKGIDDLLKNKTINILS